MTTSQRKGVVSLTSADGILNRYTEDAVQQFFTAATGLPGHQVMPEGQYYKPVGEPGTFAFYRIMPPQSAQVLDKQELADGGGEVYTYSGEAIISFICYGERARDIAMALRDAAAVPQTAHVLHEAGFGVIDAQLMGVFAEPDAGHFIERADLQIRCNFVYKRTYEVKAFAAANSQIFS